MKLNTKVIALSSISAGFTSLCLTLGAYVNIIDIFTVVLTACFTILPLYKNSYIGSILSFLAGGVLAFLFSSFNFLSIVFVAYFGFFGIFPIFRLFFYNKNPHAFIPYLIGLIWCIGVFYGLYFYYTFVMGQPFNNLPNFIVDKIYFFIGLIGFVFYVVFERFVVIIKRVEDRFLSKIIKK